MTPFRRQSFTIPGLVLYFKKKLYIVCIVCSIYDCFSFIPMKRLFLCTHDDLWFDWCLSCLCASTSLFLALLCMLSSTTSKQVLWGLLMPVEGSFMCVEIMYSVEGAKHPAVHFQTQGSFIPLMTRVCYSLAPHTQRQAPIDAHHPSSTAARTQADWLQFYNDDKSHKHCQRHSDSKKHPLKIHPDHIASYFKHSPTPHLWPEFLCRRLITVVITFAAPVLGKKNLLKFSFSSDEVIVILPCHLCSERTAVKFILKCEAL